MTKTALIAAAALLSLALDARAAVFSNAPSGDTVSPFGTAGTPGETYAGMIRHNVAVIVKALK